MKEYVIKGSVVLSVSWEDDVETYLRLFNHYFDIAVDVTPQFEVLSPGSFVKEVEFEVMVRAKSKESAKKIVKENFRRWSKDVKIGDLEDMITVNVDIEKVIVNSVEEI